MTKSARLERHPDLALGLVTPTYGTIAGVDEAGRGPLAGPVCAAAVILPPGFDPKGIDDSKKLSREQREELAQRIKEQCVWSIAWADVEEIDRLNILWATMAAMSRAIRGLSCAPEKCEIDGDKLPLGLPCPAVAIVDGDATHAHIAAASILAKTARDDLMRELDASYPGYGFASHFGYSTPDHKRALSEFGPCAIHRRSFAPCRQEEQFCLALDEG